MTLDQWESDGGAVLDDPPDPRQCRALAVVRRLAAAHRELAEERRRQRRWPAMAMHLGFAAELDEAAMEIGAEQ